MKRAVEYIKNMLLERVTCIYKNSVVKRVIESNKKIENKSVLRDLIRKIRM